jgi:Ice-binding-like/Bacterial Ig-like domain
VSALRPFKRSRARAPFAFISHARLTRLAIGGSALLVAVQVGTLSVATAEPSSAAPAAAAFVDLGTAATYSILGGSGVANTGAGTVLSGDLGLSPTGVIAGFPPGTVKGTVHDKDAAAEAAQDDRATAYANAAGQVSTDTFAGDQAGVTFHPGVHTMVAAFTNTGTITLDAGGDASAVFVFQIGAALSSAAGTKVVLSNGALANNVFWQVAGAVALGAGAKFVGTFLGAGAITFGDGASIKGRVLTPGTVAVTNSPFTEPIDDLTAPLVHIDGGATRSTNDTTPPISGTTDEPVGRTVTVTVAGQTLKTTVAAGGVWSVSSGALSPGSHAVAASITDPSQNTGSATQILTVDVSAPAVSIDGGTTTATNDVTPMISGTTDEPAGTTVTVTVDGQRLLTTNSDTGTWSVNVATLTEAPHLVTASVQDAASNTGTASQILSVDLTLPVVTIDGGSTSSTTDTSPLIRGTTAEQAGTTVDVSIGGQALTGTVITGGTWRVAPDPLPAGSYEVAASVTDAAGNTGTAAQILAIGTVAQPPAHYQPDAAIRPLHGTFVGVGIYDGSVQRVTTRLRGSARTATFQVRLSNAGDSADRMDILGTPRSRKFTVTYLAGGRDVTSAVTAGTFSTSRLASGGSAKLAITVTRTRAASPGDTRTFTVRASSAHASTMSDAVSAVVRLTR